MNKSKDSSKIVNVSDVKCKDCPKHRDALGLYDGGLCTRFCIDCATARPACVKSRWYTEMCTLNALLDAELA